MTGRRGPHLTSPSVGSAEEWAKRDAAVVWHGFTQMACYTENAPVIVESAEGHELIDVDGRRYLDAISSLWVTTLGHRVPALDQAARDQLDRVAHSTMLGHGNRAAIELAEALAQVVPVDGPHFLFASEHAAGLAAGGVEPLVQGAAGMQVAAPSAFAELADACREHAVLLVCDEVATGFGRTGTLFASEQCGLRPDLLCLGKGLTGGYLPQSATVASQRVFDAFLGPDLSEQTLYHGHSYGGNALACAVARRHLELLDERDVLANVRARSAELQDLLDQRVAAPDAVPEGRPQGPMGGVELAAA